jgi:uncharacterized phage-associated protein
MLKVNPPNLIIQNYELNKDTTPTNETTFNITTTESSLLRLINQKKNQAYYKYRSLPQQNPVVTTKPRNVMLETQGRSLTKDKFNPQEKKEKKHKEEPHTTDALDVACYFLYRVDREAGDTISPLKLQKLVYYAQAWSLALKDKPLFSEEIQAWVHGPVVYKVWDAYKEYKYSAIPLPSDPLPEFIDDQIEVLDEVWNTYGELSAKRLEQLTHSETPWIKARQGFAAGERSQNIISLDDMKSYYLSLVVEDGKE